MSGYQVALETPSAKMGIRRIRPEVVIKNERGDEIFRKTVDLVRVEGSSLSIRPSPEGERVVIPLSDSDLLLIQSAKQSSKPSPPKHSVMTSTNSKRVFASSQNSPFDANSVSPRTRPVTYSSFDRKKQPLSLFVPPPVASELGTPSRKTRRTDPSEIEVDEPTINLEEPAKASSPWTKPVQKPLTFVPSSIRVLEPATPTEKRPQSLVDIFEDSPQVSPDALAAPSKPKTIAATIPRPNVSVMRMVPSGSSFGNSASGFLRPTSLGFQSNLELGPRNSRMISGDIERLAPLTKRKGYPNPSSVCYCNAVVQALVTCDKLALEMMCPFWETALSSRNSSVPEAKVFNGLKQCFEAAEKSWFASPNSLIRPYLGERFAFPSTQQDAHEFLIALFSKMDVELAGEIDSKTRRAALTSQLMRKTAETFPNFDITKFEPSMVLPLSRVFESKLQKGLTCDSCKYFRIGAPESFFVHSLDFLTETEATAPVGLDELLMYNLSDDKLRDLKCEKCSEGTKARVHLSFIQLPRVLVLHVKRFVQGGVYGTSKRHDRVGIPKELDLTKLVEEELPPVIRPETTHNPSVEDLRKGRYTLIASIFHRGGRLMSGHYFTAARTSMQPEQWSLFDDDNVSGISTDWNEQEQREREIYMALYRLNEST